MTWKDNEKYFCAKPLTPEELAAAKGLKHSAFYMNESDSIKSAMRETRKARRKKRMQQIAGKAIIYTTAALMAAWDAIKWCGRKLDAFITFTTPAARIFLLCMRAYIAFCILEKVALRNDPNCTLTQDPMELWIGIGVAYLLLSHRDRKSASTILAEPHSNN